MIPIILLFIFASIALVVWGFFGGSIYVNAKDKLPQPDTNLKQIKLHSFLSAIFPTRVLLEKIGLSERIKRKLDAAHLRITSEEFFNIKLLFTIVFTVLAFFAIGKVTPVMAVGVLLGYIIPDIWLNKRIANRKYMIARVLPETVDLLGLCVEAGLDFTTATKWVIEKTPLNSLTEELAFVLEEIKWGKSRTQALRDMSKRLDISEISSFVQTLVQAERMGTPVTEAFAILSEDSRLQRFHRGERFALQAPLKILIPLIFCILPVIAIIIGGPILLQFMQGKLF